jgi:hypothetical protein
MKTDQIVKQLDALRVRYQKASGSTAGMSVPKVTELLTSAASAIHRFSPPSSIYLANCQEVLAEHALDSYKLRPHPRHWKVLAELVGVASTALTGSQS